MAVGKAAEIAFGFDLVIGSGIVRDLLGHTHEAQGAVGHVLENVLGLAQNLSRLGTVDGVEVGVILETMFPGGRKDHGNALHCSCVGHCSADPLDDPVGAKVQVSARRRDWWGRHRLGFGGRAFPDQRPARY